MEYIDFELEIRLLSGPRCRVAVRSTQGELDDEIELPSDLKALGALRASLHREALYAARKARGGAAVGVVAQREALVAFEPSVDAGGFGKSLYKALFHGRLAEIWAATYTHARDLGRGVRLKIITPDAPVALIPWELLCSPRGDYLCLSEATPLVRYFLVGKPRSPLLVRPPLRFLGVLSAGGGERLDLARERALVDAELEPLRTRGLARVEWLEGPTKRQLLEAICREDWHVLHFAGHGTFDPKSSQGLLSMAPEGGGPEYLRATDLRMLLADRPSVRLVFLNSCDGAVGGVNDLFSSTAALVAEAGIPAVLAMQFPISDDVATTFAQRVYRRIAAGAPLERAFAEARKDVYIGGSHEWATPVLFMRSAEGALLPALHSDASESPERPDVAGSRLSSASTQRRRLTPVAGLVLAAFLVAGGGIAWKTSTKRETYDLQWGGTECPGRPAEVALGACNNRRPLGWLAAELNRQIVGGKVKVPEGHELLRAASFKLVANDLDERETERNKFVFVCDAAAPYEGCIKSDYYLNVGYSREGVPRDGGVRVQKKVRGGRHALILGPLYYSKDGSWQPEPLCRRRAREGRGRG
jgi:CHAT domain